jgi:hypothetical protein
MITLTMSGKCMLKVFGYTVAILVGPLILAAIIWTVTGNPGLVGWSFWGGLLLGILAVLTDELKQREALALQRSRENVVVTSPSYAPVLTWGVPSAFHISTKTVIDLHLGMFALHVALHTDSVRSKCVLSQYTSTHTQTDQITQD